MQRSARMQQTGKKHLPSALLEKKWRAQQVNSRENALLQRRLETITKQQQTAVKSIEKEKAMLQRVLVDRNLRRCKSVENCASRAQTSRSASINPAACNTRTLAARRASEPVERSLLQPLLPPINTTLRHSKSATQLHQMHADLTHSGLRLPSEDVEINELPLSPDSKRHLPQSPWSKRQQTKYDHSLGVTVTSSGARLSPLPDHQTFKGVQKTNTEGTLFQQHGVLPRITVVEPSN